MATRYSLPDGRVFVTDGLSRKFVANPLANDVLNSLGCKLVSIADDHLQAFHDGLRDLDAETTGLQIIAQGVSDVAKEVFDSYNSLAAKAGTPIDTDALAAKVVAAINLKVDAAGIGTAVAHALAVKLGS